MSNDIRDEAFLELLIEETLLGLEDEAGVLEGQEDGIIILVD